MPITEQQIEDSGAPIAFERPGRASVRIGPCEAMAWQEDVIPLDGRHYVCAGRIRFRNGTELRAQFEINTHTFDYLDYAHCFINGTWYEVNEPELYKVLGLTQDEARPFTWWTDIPLEGEPGPHAENWLNNVAWGEGSA